MLSGTTLLLLAAMWGVVLLPRAVRDVRSSPVSTVTGFNDAMARLAVCDQRLLVVPSGSGRTVVVHPRRGGSSDVVRRRRAMLVRLLVGTVGTLVVALVVGGPLAWSLLGLAVVVLVAYCGALRAIARRRAPVPVTVPRTAEPEPEAAPPAAAHLATHSGESDGDFWAQARRPVLVADAR